MLRQASRIIGIVVAVVALWLVAQRDDLAAVLGLAALSGLGVALATMRRISTAVLAAAAARLTFKGAARVSAFCFAGFFSLFFFTIEDNTILFSLMSG